MPIVLIKTEHTCIQNSTIAPLEGLPIAAIVKVRSTHTASTPSNAMRRGLSRRLSTEQTIAIICASELACSVVSLGRCCGLLGGFGGCFSSFFLAVKGVPGGCARKEPHGPLTMPNSRTKLEEIFTILCVRALCYGLARGCVRV